MSKLNDQALALHREHHGKIEMHSKVPLQKAKDLTLAYSPGVAAPCLEIQKDYNKIYDYTNKGNTVAVVTNGSAVLGLGNIGAGAIVSPRQLIANDIVRFLRGRRLCPHLPRHAGRR